MSDLPKGQILPGTPFGDKLTELAKQSETVVEIGTWYGQGSTLCLQRGIVRETQRMWSFETSKECYEEAKRFHAGEPKIQIIHGAVTVDPGLSNKYLIDRRILPSQIDLLLIDGGECNGSDDLDALIDRTKIVALDDTNNFKNKRNVELLRSLGWETLAHVSGDRNGWAIFKRPCKVLAWGLGFWHDWEHARRFETTYASIRDWKERMTRAFDPIEIFIAAGSWSDPNWCPVEGIKVVNAGLPFTKPYEGHKHHYGNCAFTAAMAYACNRPDWDYLVTLDTDALIGAVNFKALFDDFGKRPECIMAPTWLKIFMGGPFMAWKREGALRMLNNRRLSNLRDDDEPPREIVWEEECAQIYRDGRWWNPWPDMLETTMSGNYYEDTMKPVREKWPFVRQPHAPAIEPYLAEHYSKMIGIRG